MNKQDWVSWFRHASPYINTHRKQTLVIALSGAALQHENLEHIIHDLTLLNSLGVRLIVVFGARPQIDSALAANEIKSRFHRGLRVTDQQSLPLVVEAYGKLRAELEARFSMGLVNSPMHGARMSVVSGNFVMAKPIGVLDGVDLCHTGVVRKVQHQALSQILDAKAIVLMPAMGYSVTGDIFNLGYEDLAAEVAVQTAADKLIFLGQEDVLRDASANMPHELSVDTAAAWASDEGRDRESRNQLAAAAKAGRSGVARIHILSYTRDGALLEELFTRDGSGTMVNADNYDEIRAAGLEDINGIQELIVPLEEQGYLVRRSRERLEIELDYFLVDVRDNAIIGCAALYPFPSQQAGELSCFAVHEAYRREGRGDKLLAAIVDRAKAMNLQRLFVLTTKTEHWFRERGFEPVAADQLPGEKIYNKDRNAKVLVKSLAS
ncbi:MAG: amino-acid N-acetyltransferase [Oleiphilaceae bacterium]|nr:amino-acid N-acetyltransferase [Oleiphilaceae bacterium]